MRAEPRLQPSRAFVRSFNLPGDRQAAESLLRPRNTSKEIPSFIRERFSVSMKSATMKDFNRESFALTRKKSTNELIHKKKNIFLTPSESLKTKGIKLGYGSFKGPTTKIPPIYLNFKSCERTPRSAISSKELSDGRKQTKFKPSMASSLIDPQMFTQTCGDFCRNIDKNDICFKELESGSRLLKNYRKNFPVPIRSSSTKLKPRVRNGDLGKISSKSFGMVKALNTQKRAAANPIKSSLQENFKYSQIHKSKTQPELVTNNLIHFEGFFVNSRNIQAIREDTKLTDTKKIELLLKVFDKEENEPKEYPYDDANDEREHDSKYRSFLEEIPEDEKEDDEHDLTMKDRLRKNKSTTSSACKNDHEITTRVNSQNLKVSKPQANEQKLIRLSIAKIGLS